MTGTHGGLLVLLLIGSTAEAGRTGERSAGRALVPGAFDKSVVKDINTVCGGTAIRDLLSVDESSFKKTFKDISNRNWKKIFATIKSFIATTTSDAALLADEIARLDQQIEQQRLAETPDDLTDDAVKQVITAAVGSENAFASLEGAVQSSCGHDQYNGKFFTKIVNRNKAAKEAFRNGLTSLDYKFRMMPDDFIAVCTTFLPSDDEESDEDNSYCDELCQSFSDILVECTESANVGTSSDDLMKRRDAKKDERKHKMSELAECESAKVTLTGFSGCMTQLKNSIRDINDERIETQEALNAAEMNLATVQNNMNMQDKELEELTALLSEAEGNVANLEQLLEKARENDARCSQNLESTKTTLGDVQASLQRATSANMMVNEVKAAVSNVMLQMVNEFESAVRVPMAKIGLSWDTDIDGFFPKSAGEMARLSDVKASVDMAKKYCENVATPAFNEMSQGSLTALCGMGEVASINSEIETSVTERINQAKAALRVVQSLLHLGPLVDGQRRSLDEAKITDRANKGEPLGLWNTLGVYGEIPFFREYLMKWALGQDFQLRIAKLKTLVSDLENTQAATSKALGEAIAEAAAANQLHKALGASLEKAINDKNIKKENAEAAKRTLDQITAQAAQADTDLEELRKKLALLEAELVKAKKTLVSTYKDGTRLVEIFDAFVIRK